MTPVPVISVGNVVMLEVALPALPALRVMFFTYVSGLNRRFHRSLNRPLVRSGDAHHLRPLYHLKPSWYAPNESERH